MGSNTYGSSAVEPARWVLAPALPYAEEQNSSLVFFQSAEQRGIEAQNPNLRPFGSLVPKSSVAQQNRAMLQGSTPRNLVPPLEGSHVSEAHPGATQDCVAVQSSWASEPTEEDWIQHKSKIKALYKDMTLKEVMAIMRRDHGFKASIKMYKDRIRKWSIDKNIKGEEMKAIIRKQAQRSRVGKKSAFRLRDSQVSESKIVRYRKSKRLSSDAEALMLGAETPPELICYTPPASPLTTPLVFEIPERIARSVQDYINSSFDSGVWLITENHWCIGAEGSDATISTFYSDCLGVINYLNMGEKKNAARVLNIAMAKIEQMVAGESPFVLDALAQTIRQCILFPPFREFALTLLKQFSAMSATMMKRMHPFNQIFPRLLELDMSHLEQTLLIASQSQIDVFVRISGLLSFTTVHFRVTKLVFDTREDAVLSEQGYISLAQECDSAFGFSDVRSLRVRVVLAMYYLNQGKFSQAVEAAQCVIAHATQSNGQSNFLLMNALFVLSSAQYELSELDSAKQNLRRSISAGIDYFGLKNGELLKGMSLLASWLEEWGRPDEAAEMRRQHDYILDLKSDTLEFEEEKRYQRVLAPKM